MLKIYSYQYLGPKSHPTWDPASWSISSNVQICWVIKAKIVKTRICILTNLLLPDRPPKTNIWQSIATAMWNARGLGPACPTDPFPLHSGWNHNLFSETFKRSEKLHQYRIKARETIRYLFKLHITGVRDQSYKQGIARQKTHSNLQLKLYLNPKTK